MNIIKDLLLDEETHDLKIENFDLKIVEAAEAISQNLKVRLEFFQGEYFLNTVTGLPLYQDIYVKNPNLGNIDAIIKTHIADTPGVNNILAYESTFNRQARRLTVNFTVDTAFGSITQEEII
jgi:hypothetical protein